MKTTIKILGATLVAGLALMVSAPETKAAVQYGDSSITKTLLNIQGTNAPGATTNVAAIGGTNHVTLTTWDSFALEVRTGLTNASAGTIDLAWQTSLDGVNWGNSGLGAGGGAGGGSSGWFSVPLTNGGTACVWSTNVTVGSMGYWRISWATNNSTQNATNWVIKAWPKPRRQG
jgi:hypothetical protein